MVDCKESECMAAEWVGVCDMGTEGNRIVLGEQHYISPAPLSHLLHNLKLSHLLSPGLCVPTGPSDMLPFQHLISSPALKGCTPRKRHYRDHRECRPHVYLFPLGR